MTKKAFRGQHPKLLPHVLQAIADLQDIRGSTTKKIIDQVQTTITASRITPKPRNVVMQVKRALRHGLQTGILKQRAGKFTLGIGNTLGLGKVRMGAPTLPVRMCRRRRKGKKAGKRKRRRRRRLATHQNDSTSSTTVSTKSFTTDSSSAPSDSDTHSRRSRSYSASPADRGGRRRKRHSKKRHRRSRRRRRRSEENESNAVNPQNEPPTENLSRRRHRKRLQSEHRKDYENQRMMDMPADCNNPDCLCGMKQEPDDNIRRMSDVDMRQRGSDGYIN